MTKRSAAKAEEVGLASRQARKTRSIVGAIAVALCLLSAGLVFAPPVAAQSSTFIGNATCSGGAGEVFATVTNSNSDDMYVQLRGGGRTTGFWVLAGTTGSQSISGIPDGTHTIDVIWGSPPFQAYLASEPRSFDCEPDVIPLSRPSVSVSRSGSTLAISWGAVVGATNFDYRVTDDGTQFTSAISRSGRSYNVALGGRYGRICVHVTAKASGRQSSAEGTRCLDVPNPTPLSQPTVSTSVSGTRLTLSWSAVSGATVYDYRITDDGNRFAGRTNTSSRSATIDLGTRHGRLCVYVTAKASGRQSSTEGTSCRTVANPTPLARPSVSTTLSGTTLGISWAAISGATTYDYRITDDGTQFTSAISRSGRSYNVALGGRYGNICVHVTARASGRQSSTEGTSCRTVANPTPLARPSVSTSISSNSLRVTWPAVSGATNYDYRITDDGTTFATRTNQAGRGFDYPIGSRTGSICVYVTLRATGRQSSAEGSSCETVFDPTPLARPSLTTSISNGWFRATWPAVSGATTYDYRMTDDGTVFWNATNRTGRRADHALTSRTGNICVHVTAKATGRQSSPETTSCETVVNPIPLDRPDLTTLIEDGRFIGRWPPVSAAMTYDYRITDDGTQIASATNRTGRSVNLTLGSRQGNICLHVTAKATGRQSSPETTSCKTVLDPTPLARPTVSTRIDDRVLVYSWPAVSAATTYDVRLTDDGTQFWIYTNRTGRIGNFALGNRTGNICAHVTAKATGRQSSVEGVGCTNLQADDIVVFGAPGCAASPRDKGTLTYTITNRSSQDRTYDVRVGSHGDPTVRVLANRTRSFTLQGILNGRRTATVWHNGSRIAVQTGLTWDCHNRLEPVDIEPIDLFDGPNFEASWSEVINARDYHWTIYGPGYSRAGGTDELSASIPLGNNHGLFCLKIIAVAGGFPADSTPSVECGRRVSADIEEAMGFLANVGLPMGDRAAFRQAMVDLQGQGIGVDDSLLLLTGDINNVIERRDDLLEVLNSGQPFAPGVLDTYRMLADLLEQRRVALQVATGEVWDGVTEIVWHDDDRPPQQLTYGETHAEMWVTNESFSYLRDHYTFYWTPNGWNVGQVSMAVERYGQPQWSHYNYETGIHDVAPRETPTPTMYEIMQDHADTSYMGSYPMHITPQYFPNGPIAPDFRNYPDGGSSNCFIDIVGPPVPVTECGVGGMIITLAGMVLTGPDLSDIAVPLAVYIYSVGPPAPTIEGPSEHMHNGVPIRPGG